MCSALIGKRRSWFSSPQWPKDFANPAVIFWAAFWAFFVELVRKNSRFVYRLFLVELNALFSPFFLLFEGIEKAMGQSAPKSGPPFIPANWRRHLIRTSRYYVGLSNTGPSEYLFRRFDEKR